MKSDKLNKVWQSFNGIILKKTHTSYYIGKHDIFNLLEPKKTIELALYLIAYESLGRHKTFYA